MLRRLAYVKTLVVAGLLVSFPAGAVPYTFTTIDVPGSIFTEAFGINNAGQIVGRVTDSTGRHGFLFDGGTFTTIDCGDPFDINNAGQIVGAGGPSGAFLFEGGTCTPIEVPVPVSTFGIAAYGINDTGQIVGQFLDNTGDHGFFFDGVTFTTIDFPGARTLALGISNTGQIVGTAIPVGAGGDQGFLFDGGTFSTINVPGAQGSGITQAFGINNTGQIVGLFTDGAGVHGFLFDSGTFTTIDVPGAAGQTIATGINDAGQILGLGFLATPTVAEPSSLILFGVSLLGLALTRRRRTTEPSPI